MKSLILQSMSYLSWNMQVVAPCMVILSLNQSEDSKNGMLSAYSNKYLRDSNIAIPDVLRIEISNLKICCQMTKITSKLLILVSRHVYQMTRRLRYFVAHLLIWHQKSYSRQNIVAHLPTFGHLVSYYLRFYQANSLIEVQQMKNFIIKFARQITTIHLLFRIP